ncbi:MAG: polymerase, sigma-24 subunit, subfamily [Thermoleophilia bacterium]|nr:polymerase, sigma-24 subunit, subfamily [Thermoleophilia bacterium]
MPSATTPREPRSELASDAALLARSIAEPAAFDEVYRRHAAAIFVFAAARVGPSHAEDLTADTFATAFGARAKFDAAFVSARPWLFGIMVNKLRRHAKVEQLWLQRAALHRPELSVTESGMADARVDALRAAPSLAAALATLTAAERDVLLLHVFEDLTHTEIAQLLGIRRGTAKTRLSRGRERLRRELAALDLTGDAASNTEVHDAD